MTFSPEHFYEWSHKSYKQKNTHYLYFYYSFGHAIKRSIQLRCSEIARPLQLISVIKPTIFNQESLKEVSLVYSPIGNFKVKCRWKTPGLLATDIHIQKIIFLPRNLSEPPWKRPKLMFGFFGLFQGGSERFLGKIIWIWICEYVANNPGVMKVVTRNITINKTQECMSFSFCVGVFKKS